MAKIELKINGKAYPAEYTNGAALRFKHETGYDITKSDGGLADSVILLFCSIQSACKREGTEFPYTLEEFADNTPLEVVSEWAKTTFVETSEASEDDKKK